MTQDTPDIVDPAFLNGIMQAPTANEARLVRWIDGLRQRVAELHRQLEEATECGQRHAARVAELERDVQKARNRHVEALRIFRAAADISNVERAEAAESQRDAALEVLREFITIHDTPSSKTRFGRYQQAVEAARALLSSTPSTLRQRERAVIEAARPFAEAHTRAEFNGAPSKERHWQCFVSADQLAALRDALAALTGDRHE